MQFSYFIHGFPVVHLNERLRPKKAENSGIKCAVKLGLSVMIYVPNEGISGTV